MSSSKIIEIAMLSINVQNETTPETTLSEAMDCIDEQVLKGTSKFIILPELWLTGAFVQNAFDDENVEKSINLMNQFVSYAKSKNLIGCLGSYLFKDKNSNFLYNRLLVLDHNQNLYKYDKIHLFGHESKESLALRAGEEILVVDVAGIRFGFAICYDLRFPELFRKMRSEDVEVFVLSAAWPANRVAQWNKLLASRAIENQSFVIAVNSIGLQGDTELGGNSQAVSPYGELEPILKYSPSYHEFKIDLSIVENYRSYFMIEKDRRFSIRLN